MNIIDLINLKLLGINALFVTGLYYCCDYDLSRPDDQGKQVPADDAKNIFWFVKWWLVRKAPLWLTKPLCGCMMCMASVWGLVFILPTLVFSLPVWENLTLVVVYCMALCGINRIIYHFS
jgi:hypothetical protein